MPLKIDTEKNEITLSVTELVAEEPVLGTSQLAAVKKRLAAGREAHQSYQQKQTDSQANYRHEVAIHCVRQLAGFSVIIQGRIDGVLEEPIRTGIEEIKSVILNVTAFQALNQTSYPHYATQLRIYCYLLEQMDYPAVSGQIVFVNLVDGAEKKVPVDYEKSEIEELIDARLHNIIENVQAKQLRNIERQTMSEILAFPFPEIRSFQQDFINDIEEALMHHNSIMLSAPAGIGKTVGSLFPLLRYALQNDKIIFYLTSKTTQQRIVQETVDAFNHQEGIQLRAITLQAKEKICPREMCLCHEEFCPLIAKHFTKLADGTISATVLAQGNITPELLSEIAATHEVCPYELSLDLSLRVDVIICDYNYVFDPRVYLKRFFNESGKARQYLVIIDEAHNLYARGREYYSQSIYRDELEALLYECQKYSGDIFRELSDFLKELNRYLSEIDWMSRLRLNQFSQALFEPDQDFIRQRKAQLDNMMLNYFTHKKLNQLFWARDPIDEFYHRFVNFELLLNQAGEESAFIFDRKTDNIGIKIMCKDPSNFLQKRMQEFHGALAMSATFAPLDFYQQVLGFPPDTRKRNYPSPFPVANRKILVDTRISTRYKHRQQSYCPLAEMIQSVVSLKRGNYFIFFPSFDYLKQVTQRLYLPDYVIIEQQQRMTDHDRHQVLQQLKQPDEATVVFAVQGGIFSEGVDYPGTMLIGVLIIGPALPPYAFEQELIKQYYQERQGAGFEYAYLFPGINRVIQSAGRVIRTPTDRGIIILIGQRFGTRYYNAHFPAYWYEHTPAELITDKLIDDIRHFWGETESC